MSYDDTKDWKAIVCHEYEVRKNLELQLAELTDTLAENRQALKTSASYTEILERKFNELQFQYNSQHARLKEAIELLKNAKMVIATRKKDLTVLQAENQQLKDALSKKTEELAEEQLQHATTSQQLKDAVHKLQATNEILVAEVETAEIKEQNTSDQLETYFMHKIMSTPSSDLVSEASLDEDTEFIANLMYLEQQYGSQQ